MKKLHPVCAFFLVVIIAIPLTGCATSGKTLTTQTAISENQSADAEAEHPADWNEATHGKDAEPDYAVVFPQDSVNRIDITLTTEAWADLQAEMSAQFGEQGAGDQGSGPGRAEFQQPSTSTESPPGSTTPGRTSAGWAAEPPGYSPSSGQFPTGQSPREW